MERMERMGQPAGFDEAERRRVEAVVETLATLDSTGDSLAELAHDARNMVTALGLYCDLLEEPGVLASSFLHYGSELRLVAAASRRLVEKMVELDRGETPGAAAAAIGPLGAAGEMESMRGPGGANAGSAWGGRMDRARRWEPMPSGPIESLAGELAANRNLLSALAGPGIALAVEIEGGALPVRLTGEDLTRVLVNLVKNAAEAMPAGGCIALGLHERTPEAGAAPWLALTVEDNGPGIGLRAPDRIFTPGYTTRSNHGHGGWPAAHRGLGLSITRSIVEAAGGRIHAANRVPAGARIVIELPVRMR